MPNCGSQVVLCDLPVRFDTYKGCSHGCVYCFVKKKVDIAKVKPFESVKALKSFVEGNRNQETSWCDWNIPLHWGGVSDPFQPVEKEYKRSLECLKYFAETKYPFVFSTKGRLIVEPQYIALLQNCNVVAQVSMVSPRYDKLEPGAPSFEERMAMLPKLSEASKRLIVRISPYSTGLADEVASLMPRYKAAGVYGVEIEAMKRSRKHVGFVKIGGDWCYPTEILRRDFEKICEAAKDAGLAFFVGENRLRSMGDSTCCCGVEGVDGFKPNKANMNQLIPNYTQKMYEQGTSKPFQQGFAQTQSSAIALAGMSYVDCMEIARRSKPFLIAMGRWRT